MSDQGEESGVDVRPESVDNTNGNVNETKCKPNNGPNGISDDDADNLSNHTNSHMNERHDAGVKSLKKEDLKEEHLDQEINQNGDTGMLSNHSSELGNGGNDRTKEEPVDNEKNNENHTADTDLQDDKSRITKDKSTKKNFPTKSEIKDEKNSVDIKNESAVSEDLSEKPEKASLNSCNDDDVKNVSKVESKDLKEEGEIKTEVKTEVKIVSNMDDVKIENTRSEIEEEASFPDDDGDDMKPLNLSAHHDQKYGSNRMEEREQSNPAVERKNADVRRSDYDTNKYSMMNTKSDSNAPMDLSDNNDRVKHSPNAPMRQKYSDDRPSAHSQVSQKPMKAKPPADNIRPVGRMLYDLGLDLVRQEVYKDLIDIQAAKDEENKLDEKEKGQLVKLTEAHSRLRSKNSAYHISRIRCASHCKFGSTSENVLAMHREFGHTSSGQPGYYLCCVCDSYRTKFPSQFITHMETMHKISGKLYKKPLQAVCAYCPYEHKNVAKVEAHSAKCSKKFQLSCNLQPLPSDCDIPIKYRPVVANSSNWQRPVNSGQYNTGSPQMPHSGNSSNSAARGSNQSSSSQSSSSQSSVMEIGGQLYSWGNHRGKPLLTSLRSQISNSPGGSGSGSSGSFNSTSGGSVSVRPPGMQPRQPQMPQSSRMSHQNTSSMRSGPPQPSRNNAGTPQNLSRSAGSTPQTSSSGRDSSASSSSPRGSTGQSPQKRTTEVCEICGMNVDSRQALWNHLHTAHKLELSRVSMSEQEPGIVCDICKARFWTYQGLARHSLLLHKRNISSGASSSSSSGGQSGSSGVRFTFRCHLCGASQTVNPLNHLSTHHNITLLDMYHGRQCCMCNRKLRTSRAFEEHMVQEHRDIFANQDVLRTVLQALSTALYLKSEDVSQQRRQPQGQQNQQFQHAASAAAAALVRHGGDSSHGGSPSMRPRTPNSVMSGDKKPRGRPPILKPEPVVMPPPKPTPEKEKKTTEEETKVLNKLYEDYADIGRPISRAMKQKLLTSPTDKSPRKGSSSATSEDRADSEGDSEDSDSEQPMGEEGGRREKRSAGSDNGDEGVSVKRQRVEEKRDSESGSKSQVECSNDS